MITLLLLCAASIAPAQSAPDTNQTSGLAQAQALENQLKSDPDNLGIHKQLVYFYGLGASDLMKPADAYAALRPHLLWLIEHDPRSEVLRMVSPVVQPATDAAGFAAAKKVWDRQIQRYAQDTGVLENAGWFFAQSDRPRSEQLFQRVLRITPGETMVAAILAKLYRNDASQSKTEKEKRAFNAKAIGAMEESLRHADPEDRFDGLTDFTKLAFETGDLSKAESSAHELLVLAPAYKDSWNYGNAIHQANIVLGRIRLREGKVKEASRYLLLAGATPGSPQLDSYGPDLSLARELLAHGERDAVLQYLDQCSKFWESGRDLLQQWTADIKADRTPDFSSKKD